MLIVTSSNSNICGITIRARAIVLYIIGLQYCFGLYINGPLTATIYTNRCDTYQQQRRNKAATKYS